MNKKVFILLPDGVGLRNFAFTQFNEIGRKQGFDIVYWNNTVFDIASVGFNEVKIQKAKLHPFTDILKNAKIHIGLNRFIKNTKDPVYNTYRFPFSNKTIKAKLRKFITKSVVNQFDSDKGLASISEKIKQMERKTAYYKSCKETLKKESPAFIFCTNQRPVTAIAPLLAAQDLGIPTGTFIFHGIIYLKPQWLWKRIIILCGVIS